MIGVGILPLAIATWLWSGAIQARAHGGAHLARRAVPLVRAMTVVALASAAVGLAMAVNAFVAVKGAPASTRATLVASSIEESMLLSVVAFAIQTTALLATAGVWLVGRRRSQR